MHIYKEFHTAGRAQVGLAIGSPSRWACAKGVPY